MRSTTNKVDRL